MFPDNKFHYYSTNMIATNIYSQVDENGYWYQLTSEIFEHKTDSTTITMDDEMETSKNCYKEMKKITIGWKFMVQWKDDTNLCIKLKGLNASNDVEGVDYISKVKCVSEPSFEWWVPYVLKKKSTCIINKFER